MKQRLYYVDLAKAICIFLVVVGHFNPASSPDWWKSVYSFIYSFHMPVFMFLSGLLFATSQASDGYFSFVARKAERLLVPYFCASIIIISIKLLTQMFLTVKNEVSLYAFVEMLWRPSAAAHLWFLWALIIIFLLVAIRRSECWYCFLLALGLASWISGIQLPEIFCLNKVPKMLVFFICGLLWKKHEFPFSNLWATLAAFVVLEALYLMIPSSGAVLQYVLPFAGIAFVLALSKRIDDRGSGKLRNSLMVLGESSFFIYLFHTTFSEFTKSVLSLLGITSGNHFVLCLIACVSAGVLIPLYILQKLRPLKCIQSGRFLKYFL